MTLALTCTRSGDGTFATALTYAADIQAQSIAAADFNGDGTLLATVTIALSSSPTACAAADLNHDGIADPAVILDDNATGVILSTCELGL